MHERDFFRGIVAVLLPPPRPPERAPRRVHYPQPIEQLLPRDRVQFREAQRILSLVEVGIIREFGRHETATLGGTTHEEPLEHPIVPFAAGVRGGAHTERHGTARQPPL